MNQAEIGALTLIQATDISHQLRISSKQTTSRGGKNHVFIGKQGEKKRKNLQQSTCGARQTS